MPLALFTGSISELKVAVQSSPMVTRERSHRQI